MNDDAEVLSLVESFEDDGYTHQHAVELAGRLLQLRPLQVMEACDRAINPPDGMEAPDA